MVWCEIHAPAGAVAKLDAFPLCQFPQCGNLARFQDRQVADQGLLYAPQWCTEHGSEDRVISQSHRCHVAGCPHTAYSWSMSHSGYFSLEDNQMASYRLRSMRVFRPPEFPWTHPSASIPPGFDSIEMGSQVNWSLVHLSDPPNETHPDWWNRCIDPTD
jgi:hypothetical protein